MTKSKNLNTSFLRPEDDRGEDDRGRGAGAGSWCGEVAVGSCSREGFTEEQVHVISWIICCLFFQQQSAVPMTTWCELWCNDGLESSKLSSIVGNDTSYETSPPLAAKKCFKYCMRSFKSLLNKEICTSTKSHHAIQVILIDARCHPNPTHARRIAWMQTAMNPIPIIVYHPIQKITSTLVWDRAIYRRVQQTSHHRHQPRMLQWGQGTRELYMLPLPQYLAVRRSHEELASESNFYKR